MYYSSFEIFSPPTEDPPPHACNHMHDHTHLSQFEASGKPWPVGPVGLGQKILKAWSFEWAIRSSWEKYLDLAKMTCAFVYASLFGIGPVEFVWFGQGQVEWLNFYHVLISCALGQLMLFGLGHRASTKPWNSWIESKDYKRLIISVGPVSSWVTYCLCLGCGLYKILGLFPILVTSLSPRSQLYWSLYWHYLICNEV